MTSCRKGRQVCRAPSNEGLPTSGSHRRRNTGDGGGVVADFDGSPYLIFCCNVHGLTTSGCGRIGGLKAFEPV